MRVTMVKKRLASGEPCRKCLQTEELLKRRSLWERIDEVVWAIEGDESSDGMRLAAAHGVERAPFFIVEDGDGSTTIFISALKLIKARFKEKPTSDVVPMMSEKEVVALAATLQEDTPQKAISWALERFGRGCAIAFSGAEDVILIDMASRSGLEYSVFCLDTGRLHPETYRFIEKVRTHYGIAIDMLTPNPALLQPFVKARGVFSFYEEGHGPCCDIRKVDPLKGYLTGLSAWITGQRGDQNPDTRSGVPVVQQDPRFRGKGGTLLKFNPLTAWSSEMVWAYIHAFDVPYNPLHDRGFLSIGCEPCTRATHPGQHEREGRWWWESETPRECGLHQVESTSTD